jgi:glycosyltransferase involved in cell wall biosynthesis
VNDPKPKDRPALLVFSDDWGRHPSSCQHLVSRLLPRYPVWWVNTIGMRRPGLDRTTLIRGWQKLQTWLRASAAASPTEESLQVVNPLMWPWFRGQGDRGINRRLLTWQLDRVVRSIDREVVAVTTVPVVADLIDRLPVARWVYYCVDDFGNWPGLDRQAVESMEAVLVRRADVLIAVSQTLQDRLAQWGRGSRLLTHGVDLEHWALPEEPGCRKTPPEQVAGLERPLVLFWGVLDRRMDVEMVRQMAEDMESGAIVLVGPLSDPDPQLLRLPRVRHVPPVPFDVLPRLAREAAVLVMPYADLPVTRMIQPLKLKEYLATGRPVVVRDLPATRPWADAADVAGDPTAFSAAVQRRIASGLPETQRAARRRLESEGWTAKAAEFEKLALEGF